MRLTAESAVRARAYSEAMRAWSRRSDPRGSGGDAGQPVTRSAARRRWSGSDGVILVDTSAWVDFDRATGSSIDARLTDLIRTTDEVAVTEPVIMEVVAGARDERRGRDLQRLMQRFTLLRFDAAVDFDAATRIYRRCREAGVTPRGMVDCMIAAVALRHTASLLAADVDIDRIAGVMDIALDLG